MEYKKSGDVFTLEDSALGINDSIKKVGLVVDCFKFPERDPIVIRHGEYDKVKKYFDGIISQFEKGTGYLMTTLTKTTILIDASDWTVEEINASLDMDARKILLEKNIQVPPTPEFNG